MNAHRLGIALKLASTLGFALMFAALRFAQPLSAGQIMCFRSLFSLLFVSLLGLRTVGLGSLMRVKQKLDLSIAAALSVASMFVNLVALRHLPLATFTTLTFLAPLFAVTIAAVVLGERVGIARWLALFVGLSGIILITSRGHLSRLAPALLTSGAGFGLLGALGAGLTFVMMRKMAGREDGRTISFYCILACAVAGAGTLLWQYQSPTLYQWAVLTVAGLCGAASQLLMSFCYSYAGPALLAPYEYAGIVWATLLGFILFGEIPDIIALVGIFLVTAAGLSVAWRDFTRSTREAVAKPT